MFWHQVATFYSHHFNFLSGAMILSLRIYLFPFYILNTSFHLIELIKNLWSRYVRCRKIELPILNNPVCFWRFSILARATFLCKTYDCNVFSIDLIKPGDAFLDWSTVACFLPSVRNQWSYTMSDVHVYLLVDFGHTKRSLLKAMVSINYSNKTF